MAAPVKQEEPIKILLKYCNNFIKMNKDEKSEGIKINYWMGIENQMKLLKIDNETSIKVIFEEIFKKQTAILKTKHLLFCITNFLKPMNEAMFVSNFFELLMIFAKEYDDNRVYFNEYLIELSLSFFFEANFRGKEGGEEKDDEEGLGTQFAFFNFLIEKDIEVFSSHFDAYYFKADFAQKLFDFSRYVKLFNAYLNKVSSINQFQRFQYLISGLKGIQIKEEQMGNIKLFYSDLLKMLIELISRNIKNTQTSIMNVIQLIYCTIQLTFSILNEIERYDAFLLNALELIISTKTFHFELIKILNDIYSKKTLTSALIMFKNIFPCVIYFFSNSLYDKAHIEFFLKAIESMPSLYRKIIIKRINVMQMIPHEMVSQSSIAFNIIDDNNNGGGNSQSPNSSFVFPIEESIKRLKYVSNLNLIDYLIKSCICFSSSNDPIESIGFNEMKFFQILHCLSLLSIQTLSLNLFEAVSEFILIFISSIIDLSLVAKIPISQRIIRALISIIKHTSIEHQTETIYPIVIQIMREALIPNYELFIDNNSNQSIPLFFEYLCEFARNDNIALLTSRLLVVLYNSKTIKGNDHKIYSLKTLANLCITANNSKIFQFYFGFAKDQANAPISKPIALSSINDYALNYEGALQSPLLEYAMSTFQQIFDKSIDLMQFDSDALFAISTLAKIFQKDKTEELIQLLKQYFLKYTFIEVITKIASLIKEGNVIQNELGINEEEDDNNPQLDLINSVNILLDNMSCLDYSKYITSTKALKCSTCLYAILKQVSMLLSELLSHFINEENESNAQSEVKQQSPVYLTIIKYYDFLWEKIVNSKGKETSGLIIINEIISNKSNYDFFYVTHSNIIANKQIKDTQSGFSHLVEFTLKAINEKQNALISAIKKNKMRIFLFKNAFEMILLKEIQMISLNYQQSSHQNRVIIIKSIWENSFLDTAHNNSDNHYTIDISNSFFVLELMLLLMSKDNLIQNQVLYSYCLYNKIFSTYFKPLVHLIDLDYIMLEYYSIIREKNCPKELIGNYFDFVSAFIRISKPVQVFALRMLSNNDIYADLVKKGQKKLGRLFDIALILFESLIRVNSYQMESKETLVAILDNMQKNIQDSPIYQRDYLVSYADFLLKLVQLLSLKEKTNNKKITKDYFSVSSSNEINPKLKALQLGQLLNNLLPSLIRVLYCFIEIEFANGKEQKSDDYIDYLYKALDIILRFKSFNLVSDLTNGVLVDDIIGFIDTFTQGGETISNVFLNSLCNNYIAELKKENNKARIMAQFTINYILFKSLANEKEDRRKTIRDQTLILFDENAKKDPYEYEQRRRIGYMLLLSSLLVSNAGKPLPPMNSRSLFKGQYVIFEEIGEILSNEISSIIA